MLHTDERRTDPMDDRTRVTIMKALAIAAVVTLHVLSSLPGWIFREFPPAQWFVALDQLGRFSVPVFLGLSGYALARKHWRTLSLPEFFRRRFLKLLPLYLLWTVGLRLLFVLIPAWYTTLTPVPWWQVILLGSGDYHLYFVPLILQFYFLFPVLFSLVKRWPLSTVAVSVVLQGAALVAYTFLPPTAQWQWLTTDQAQYSVFLSWISYFVLGIFVAERVETKHFSTRKWQGSVAIMWAVLWVGLSVTAAQAIRSGVDPLYALKFTRLPVLLYGLASIALSLIVPWEQVLHWKPLKNTLIFLGTHSFLIYLAHTLVLRLIFARDLPGVSGQDTWLAGLWLVVLLGASWWLELPASRSGPTKKAPVRAKAA